MRRELDIEQVWQQFFLRHDSVSRDQLIVHYSPLVKFVAGRVGAGLPSSVDPGDLVSAGVFGLIDLIGLDLMPYLQHSLTATLAKDDPYQALARSEPLIEKLIATGYTGRKGKGGFYRLNREGGQKTKEAIDLASGEYRAEAKPAPLPSAAERGDLNALIGLPDDGGDVARMLAAFAEGEEDVIDEDHAEEDRREQRPAAALHVVLLDRGDGEGHHQRGHQQNEGRE